MPNGVNDMLKKLVMLITKFWSAFSDTFSRQKLVKKTFFFFHGNVTDLSKAWIIAGPYCVNCELSSGIPSASKITKRLYYGRLQIMPHVNSENIIFFFQNLNCRPQRWKIFSCRQLSAFKSQQDSNI